MTLSTGIFYQIKIPDFRIGRLKVINKKINLGLSVINIPVGLSIMGNPIPLTIRIAIASEVYKNLTISLDAAKVMTNIKELPTIGVGIEYWIIDMIGIRAGYRFMGADVDKFTVGLGFRKRLGKKIHFEINYAFAPPLSQDIALVSIGSLSVTIKFPIKMKTMDWEKLNQLYYKGIEYFTAEEFDKAIKIWEKCLKINPNFERAKQKIQEAENLKKLLLEETDELKKYYQDQQKK